MPSSVLVIATLAAELSSPSTAAVAAATQSALGSTVVVRVETADPGPVAAPARADLAGFVRVTWDSPEHLRASLWCYLPTTRRWVGREVAFAALDPEGERARTLGFVIASIYSEPGAAPPRRAARRTSLPVEPSRAPRYALGAAAALAGPGHATSFGPWLGLEYRGLARAWLGLSGEARFGSLPEAQATTRFVALAATGSWHALEPSPDTWLGLRLSASVVQISVSHLSSDDPVADRKSRYLPGLEAAVEAAYAFTVGSAVWCQVGASAVPGSTEVLVRGQQQAALPAVVGLARLGVRAAF